jgi:hypothetical protein
MSRKLATHCEFSNDAAAVVNSFSVAARSPSIIRSLPPQPTDVIFYSTPISRRTSQELDRTHPHSAAPRNVRRPQRIRAPPPPPPAIVAAADDGSHVVRPTEPRRPTASTAHLLSYCGRAANIERQNSGGRAIKPNSR